MDPVDPLTPVRVVEAHEAEVGGMAVRRSLPRRGRRTVGAWCFVDHFGPQSLAGPAAAGLQVGPHPHIGLQTVTWLLDGSALHTDSLGSEQVIRPGQLNVMTAGAGIAHAEQTPEQTSGDLHGVQLWVAQPEATRDGVAAFDHHPDLPELDLDDGSATVLVGTLDGETSPARTDTELVGADLALRPGRTTLPLRPDFEHALLPLDGDAQVDGHRMAIGMAALLDVGRAEVTLDVERPARFLLLGGTPFPEPIVMWWNFVARSRAEIDEARDAWAARSERFGRVTSPLPAIMPPPTPWA